MGLEMRDADSWRLDCSKAINEHVSYSGGGREQDWPAFRYELVADNRTCRPASGNVDAGFSAVALSGARLLYNAACYCSLSGEAEHVIDLLERACELGGGSRDRFEHDPRLGSAARQSAVFNGWWHNSIPAGYRHRQDRLGAYCRAHLTEGPVIAAICPLCVWAAFPAAVSHCEPASQSRVPRLCPVQGANAY